MIEKEIFRGTEDVLTKRILDVFFQVYNELGYGFVESVYARAMAIALTQDGLAVASEIFIPVSFRGQMIGTFRADLVVEDRIVLEFKVADVIVKAYEAQLTHYLRASQYEVGLILSFGESPRTRRIEFLNERKRQFQGSTLIPPLPVLS